MPRLTLSLIHVRPPRPVGTLPDKGRVSLSRLKWSERFSLSHPMLWRQACCGLPRGTLREIPLIGSPLPPSYARAHVACAAARASSAQLIRRQTQACSSSSRSTGFRDVASARFLSSDLAMLQSGRVRSGFVSSSSPSGMAVKRLGSVSAQSSAPVRPPEGGSIAFLPVCCARL